MKTPADSVSDMNPLWFMEGHLFMVPSHGRRSEGFLWGLLYMGSNIIPEDFSLMT